MKRYTLCMIIVFALFTSTVFAQEGRFGLGIIAGEPTGVSAKYWLSSNSAIDVVAAWSFDDGDSFQLHGDYLFHQLNLFEVENQNFHLYYGVGGRFRFKDDKDTQFGIRIPVGLTYLFKKHPLDAFVETAPIVNLAPKTDLDIDVGIGIRFYFN